MNPMIYPTMNPAMIEPENQNPGMIEPENENPETIDPANENCEIINPIIKLMNNNNQPNNQKKDMELNYYIPNNYEYEPRYQVTIMLIDTEKEKTFKLIVIGHNNMTIEQLVNNFRSLICDDSIVIKQYLLNDTIELDPHSKQKLLEFGINDKSIIKAIK